MPRMRLWTTRQCSSSTRHSPIRGGWRCFGRDLLHILDLLPLWLGFLWPLWDARRQTFADKIMKTVVLKVST